MFGSKRAHSAAAREEATETGRGSSALGDWLASRDSRERRFVLVGAVALALALLTGIVKLDLTVSHDQAYLAERERDLAWMRSVAPQLAAAGPVTARAVTSQSSLIVVIDHSAREAGLGAALVSSEPSRRGGLTVGLQKAPFDRMIAWLQRLADQHRVRVASATVNDAGAPGVVNATLVLRASP